MDVHQTWLCNLLRSLWGNSDCGVWTGRRVRCSRFGSDRSRDVPGKPLVDASTSSDNCSLGVLAHLLFLFGALGTAVADLCDRAARASQWYPTALADFLQSPLLHFRH